MPNYNIAVVEMLRRVISVTADNLDDAKDMVEKKYYDCNIVLDAADHQGTFFINADKPEIKAA